MVHAGEPHSAQQLHGTHEARLPRRQVLQLLLDFKLHTEAVFWVMS